MLGCAASHDKELAVKTFKEIFAQHDKDGLVPLSILKPIAPGVFEKDGLLLFAHPFFRRSLSRFNSLNASFLEVLQSLGVNPVGIMAVTSLLCGLFGVIFYLIVMMLFILKKLDLILFNKKVSINYIIDWLKFLELVVKMQVLIGH